MLLQGLVKGECERISYSPYVTGNSGNGESVAALAAKVTLLISRLPGVYSKGDLVAYRKD